MISLKDIFVNFLTFYIPYKVRRRRRSIGSLRFICVLIPKIIDTGKLSFARDFHVVFAWFLMTRKFYFCARISRNFFYDSVEIMAEGTLCTNYGEKKSSKKPESANELFFYTLSVAPRDEYLTRI